MDQIFTDAVSRTIREWLQDGLVVTRVSFLFLWCPALGDEAEGVCEVFGRVVGCILGDADDALVGLVLFEHEADVINENEKVK